MSNKILKSIAILAVMVAMTGLAIADPSPGAVMATDSTGDDTNLYPGTIIWIKGHKLAPNSPFEWAIYDMNVDCPPNVVIPGIGCGELVASDSGGATDGNGNIMHNTEWPLGGSGHYKLVVTIDPSDPRYADIYTKIDTLYPIPELSTIVLISAGIIGMFALVRLRKKD